MTLIYQYKDTVNLKNRAKMFALVIFGLYLTKEDKTSTKH